jgi:hypothetical protein
VEFKYVRDVAPPPNSTYDDTAGYNGKEAPVYGEFDTKYMTDVRCGRDAFAVGVSTPPSRSHSQPYNPS